MLEHDLEESVGCWIALTAHTMRRALDAELAREEITFRQWEVLATVALRGEQSQAALAEHLGIEAPTLAGILTRMERDGWLQRYSCPEDRRKKLIRITPRSETVWNRMLECCRRVRQRATQGLSGEDLVQFKSVCDRIRENLGAQDAQGVELPDAPPANHSSAGIPEQARVKRSPKPASSPRDQETASREF